METGNGRQINDWFDLSVASADDLPETAARPPRRRGGIAVVAAIAVVLVVIAAAGVYLHRSVLRSKDSAAPVTTVTTVSTSVTSSPVAVSSTPPPHPVLRAPVPVAGFCEKAGDHRTDGDLSTPLGVVLHVQYAFYVDRNAHEAFASYSPKATASEEKIAAAIAATPQDAIHCVHVDNDLSDQGIIDATVTVRSGQQQIVDFKQRYFTVKTGGQWKILSVKSR